MHETRLTSAGLLLCPAEPGVIGRCAAADLPGVDQTPELDGARVILTAPKRSRSWSFAISSSSFADASRFHDELSRPRELVQSAATGRRSWPTPRNADNPWVVNEVSLRSGIPVPPVDAAGALPAPSAPSRVRRQAGGGEERTSARHLSIVRHHCEWRSVVIVSGGLHRSVALRRPCCTRDEREHRPTVASHELCRLRVTTAVIDATTGEPLRELVLPPTPATTNLNGHPAH